MKGLFIPDITVEMFRNGCLESIEALMAEGEIYNIEYSKWIPVSERLPEKREWYLAVFKEFDTGIQLIPRVADYIGKGKNEWRLIDEGGLVKEYRDLLECVAWMPLPQAYKEGDGNDD